MEQGNEVNWAAKSQTDFVIDLCTEFQNNMKEWFASIKQTLESGDFASVEEPVRQLLVSGEALFSNFSNMVEYARMTEGRIELSETEYNIGKLLEFVCHNVELQLGDKQIAIVCRIDDNVPPKLLGDQAKIAQVINKLLTNAIQYTDEGVITLYISSESRGYAENLKIQISGDGMDMAAEHYEDANSYLLKQMSGNIEIKNVEGEGTTFVIWLPQLKLV